MASGPRFFRCSMVIPSGPTALEFFVFFMAFATCSDVIVGQSERVFFFTSRVICLLILSVLWGVCDVYCALKLFATSAGSFFRALENRIEWLLRWGATFSRVFHNFAEFTEWSKVLKNSCHLAVLAFLMTISIRLVRILISDDVGSHSRIKSRLDISLEASGGT